MIRIGALSYSTPNLGDEIQTLAALPYLPRVETWINRDRMHLVRRSRPTFVLMNGWFLEPEGSWPPPPSIRPLFYSFHADRPDLFSEASLAYLKQFEPIGCRSESTRRALEERSIRCSFTGCLTLTVRPAGIARRGGRCVIVDVEEPLLRRLVPSRIRRRAVYATHRYPPRGFGRLARKVSRVPAPFSPVYTCVHDALLTRCKLRLARRLLGMYESAGLVITGRLHCALPCLALGTPVLFLPGTGIDDPRLDGLLPLLRVYTSSDTVIRIDWDRPPANPVSVEERAESIRGECADRVRKELSQA